MVCIYPPGLYAVIAVLIGFSAQWIGWTREEGVTAAAMAIAFVGGLIVSSDSSLARLYGHHGLLFGISVLSALAIRWGIIPWLAFSVLVWLTFSPCVDALNDKQRPAHFRGESSALAFGAATAAVLAITRAPALVDSQLGGILIVACIMYLLAWFLVRKPNGSKRRR